jgi:Spy/CpxP family protein refolding chaperone
MEPMSRGRPGLWAALSVRLAALGVAALAGALWITGCSESGGPSRNLVSEPEASDASKTAAAYVPSFAEVEGRLELREEQVAAVRAALEELRSQALENGAPDPREKRPERGGGAEGHGPLAGEQPFLRFIERCAGILDPGQLAGLLTLLDERREAWRQEREQRMAQHDPRRGGRMDERPPRQTERRLAELTDLLGLTSEQRDALAAALREQREALLELRPETPGAGRNPESIERREAIREAFEAKLAAILTPEQAEILAAHRAEQREQRLAKREEHRTQMQERVIELLTGVLHLEPAQVETVTGIVAAAYDRAEAVHEAVRAGEIAPSDARQQLEGIRAEVREAVAAVLTAEQRTVFEALLPWLPRPLHAGPHRG